MRNRRLGAVGSPTPADIDSDPPAAVTGSASSQPIDMSSNCISSNADRGQWRLLAAGAIRAAGLQ
jgi:hypothetical protein